MKSNIISENIDEFKATRNPFYIAKAILLVISQKRMCELIYGFYCGLRSCPSELDLHPHDELQTILSDCQLRLFIKNSVKVLRRKELIDIFGDKFAIRSLPADFAGTRIEGIVQDKDFLIIGEYGNLAKRIAYITSKACTINKYYTNNPNVTHIHAIHKSNSSRSILVTTGDATKVLDLWSLHNGELVFKKRLKRYFAGYTAITKVEENYYLGTDFSSRPNYIERLDGKKYYFPSKAYKMFVIAFHQHLNRYILSFNTEEQSFDGRHTLSVFDTVRERFVYCDYLNVSETGSQQLDISLGASSAA